MYNGVSTSGSFRGKKSDQKLYINPYLHMMSHRLIIWKVQFLIDYECLDYSSFNIDVINMDIHFSVKPVYETCFIKKKALWLTISIRWKYFYGISSFELFKYQSSNGHFKSLICIHFFIFIYHVKLVEAGRMSSRRLIFVIFALVYRYIAHMFIDINQNSINNFSMQDTSYVLA